MTTAAAPLREPQDGARTFDRRVLAWASWDWGTASFNAVITTFVFTVYLTGKDFVEPAQRATPEGLKAAQADLSSALGWGIALAGIAVALLAPVTGRRADVTGRRRRGLVLGTVVVVLAMVGMTGVVARPPFFLLGVALVALGTVAYEIAAVNYNAMLLPISTPRTIGRISAVGWASGYVGGIVLLVVLFLTLIPLGPQVLGLPGLDADGLGVRLCAALAAVWLAVFGAPLFFAVPDELKPAPERLSVVKVYRALLRDIRGLWRSDRNLVVFLLASAVFRDGLTGVFTFGAVIASTVFGFSFPEVLVFGIAANLVAGVSTFASGRFDDRFGPKPVILVSLVGLVISGTAVFVLRDGGPNVFWVGGLALCLFVGPAQTSSRSLLGRLAPAERAGELFGLYATTGRAASFIAPLAFAAFVTVAHDQGFGILGIVLVIALGLVLTLRVRGSADARPAEAPREP